MKASFDLVLMVLCLMVSAKMASANTFYLAPDGNDLSGTGKTDNPWFSLNRAWQAVSAGDTVFMRGGIYYYQKQVLSGKNGNAGNLIKIWAYPEEKPIIKKAGKYANTVWPRSIIRVSADYIHFMGLEICYNSQENHEAYYGLINLNGNNNIYELLDIHHNGWTGLGIEYNSTGNLILNCDIHHNSDPLSLDKYGNADGVAFSYIPKGSVNTIRGCRIWWNTDDGIDTYGSDGKLVIDSCWIWHNGYIPDSFNPAGNGVGFKLGKTTCDLGNSVLINISNCIAYKNRTCGFHQNGACAVISLTNNTAYSNGAEGFWFGSFNKAHILKNNISYKNKSSCSLTRYAIIEKNTFLGNCALNPEITVSDTDFQNLDPEQLNYLRTQEGRLPDIEFLHLSINSDLIDKGIDTGDYFYGKAPDVGAFEKTSSEININNKPVVNISPTDKSSIYTAPAIVTLEINAYDPDGTISKVEIFNGNIKIGEISEEPYFFTLKDLEKGSYSLYAIATDNLKSRSASPKFEFCVTGDNDDKEYFKIYPNPTNGVFSINLSVSDEFSFYTMFIVDYTGKTIYEKTILPDINIQEFDISFLSPGTYILLLKSKLIITTHKIIKV